MSSSKIRVDPRTFKIINQAREQSPAQSQSQTTTETYTSDQESSTSVNSDTESVKVIKLDNPEQGGGKIKQDNSLETNTHQVKVQQSQDSNKSTTISNPNPNPNPNPSTVKKINDNNIFNYLTTNKQLNEETNTSIPISSSSENEQEDTEIVLENNINSEQQQKQQEPVEDTTQDVFDLTQNKLYQVLSKLFESTKGDGIGENLDKMSKLFETHNQIMEKILNQLIIMNTNYKQVKVPDAFHTSTKQAGNITEFRKKIDQFNPKQPQNKD